MPINVWNELKYMHFIWMDKRQIKWNVVRKTLQQNIRYSMLLFAVLKWMQWTQTNKPTNQHNQDVHFLRHLCFSACFFVFDYKSNYMSIFSLGIVAAAAASSCVIIFISFRFRSYSLARSLSPNSAKCKQILGNVYESSIWKYTHESSPNADTRTLLLTIQSDWTDTIRAKLHWIERWRHCFEFALSR